MDVTNMRIDFGNLKNPADIERMIQKLANVPICAATSHPKPQMEKNYGWICPKCGAVYAPHVKECSDCNKRRQ